MPDFMQLPPTVIPQTRAEAVREIETLELRIKFLRENLPCPFLKFFRFRTRPQAYVMVYASDRDEAERRLRHLMDDHDEYSRGYGVGKWSVSSPVVDVYDHPRDARAAMEHGSLLRALTHSQQIEFLQHFKDDKRGRPVYRRGEQPDWVSDVEADATTLKMNPPEKRDREAERKQDNEKGERRRNTEQRQKRSAVEAR